MNVNEAKECQLFIHQDVKSQLISKNMSNTSVRDGGRQSDREAGPK